MKFDVAVIGGGSAGLAAAACAAREGARVLLAERGVMPGGNATAALVHTLCGLYLLRDGDSETHEFANPGFPKEIAEALLAGGGARGPVRMGRLDVLLHRPSVFATLAINILESLPGLRLCLNTKLSGILKNGDGSVGALVLDDGEKEFTVETTAVVDTTGDGEAAARAGADYEIFPQNRLQRPSYIMGLGGVSHRFLDDDGRLAIAHALSSAVIQKLLPEGALGATFRHGVEGDVWMSIDLSAAGFDPISPGASQGQLYAEAAELAEKIILFLRDKVRGFEGASASLQPERLGIRESRRIWGSYMLTEADVLEGRRFSDEAALSAWPVELRETARGPRFRFPAQNRACGIPLRCLRSASVPNLYMAGRCLSATHEAHAALRVIGTSLATGEAAGKAAARAADIRVVPMGAPVHDLAS